jgi:hypothetical protein
MVVTFAIISERKDTLAPSCSSGVMVFQNSKREYPFYLFSQAPPLLRTASSGFPLRPWLWQSRNNVSLQSVFEFLPIDVLTIAYPQTSSSTRGSNKAFLQPISDALGRGLFSPSGLAIPFER